MFLASLLPALVICWTGATVALVVLLIFRSLVAMKEDDQLFLDPAEWQLEREQRTLLARLDRLTPFVKGLAVASTALLVLIAAIWIYRGVTNVTSLAPGV